MFFIYAFSYIAVSLQNMFAGLLKKNKDANEESTKNMMNHSAKKDAFLIDACQQGSLNLVQKFITKDFCSPNLLSPDGKSLVQLALEGGHDAVVMYLLLEQHAAVVDARGVKGLPKDEKADSLHISLIKMCVMKTTDREKAFAVAMEALAHSTNQTLSALLLAEMYKEVRQMGGGWGERLRERESQREGFPSTHFVLTNIEMYAYILRLS